MPLRLVTLALLFALLPVNATPAAKKKEKPSETETLFQRAEQYYFHKKYHIARALLLKVISQQPDHSRALPLLADICFYQKEYERALDYYLQASEILENPAQEYYRIGQIYLAQKDAERALDYFNRAYSLQPELVNCLFQLGYTSLLLKRDKQKTISYWSEFLEKSGQDKQKEKISLILETLKREDFILPPPEEDIVLPGLAELP